ncbi:MAG: hypothetical protein LBS05_00565 [Tannerellaceae bacterium]|nr:hypothetical protein [Tannerellaceae bacterium]
MKKALFILILFTLTIPVAIAQRGRTVIVYFHNGSIVKGEITKQPNDGRYRVQTPNGSIFLFTSQDVKDVRYEDGVRPGGSNNLSQQPYQSQQQQYQPQQQQYQPQQQQYQPQQQQQYQPQPQQQRQAQAQPQNTLPAEEEPAEEEWYADADLTDEGFYDDEANLAFDDTEQAASRQPQAKAPAATPRNPADFVPGYHGFVDFGYTIGMGDSAHAFNRMEATITQGYQFTPTLFAGIGTGVHLYSDSIPLRKVVNQQLVTSSLSYAFPVFVDLRYTFSDGIIRPFAALKAGYSLGLSKTFTISTNEETGQQTKRTEYKAENLGFYVAPTVGVKLMIGRALALNVGVGYSLQCFNDKTLKPNTTNVIVNKMDYMGGVTLKAGLEF